MAYKHLPIKEARKSVDCFCSQEKKQNGEIKIILCEHHRIRTIATFLDCLGIEWNYEADREDWLFE